MVAASEPSLRLANILADNMVLQRDKPVRIWGWAAPGAEVKVTITEDGESVASLLAKAPVDPPYELKAKNPPPLPGEGEYHVTLRYLEHNAKPFAAVSAKAVADADGAWEATFPPMPTSFRPKTILAQCGDEVDAARNVLVGILWLNTGQSNIERRGYDGSDLEHPAARFPAVRYCKLDGSWYKPKDDLDVPAHWLVCSPQTAGEIPGVSYFFAQALHRYLNVPVGIINNARGGTTGQAWCSRDELDTIENEHVKRQLADFDAECAAWESAEYRKQVYEAAVAEAQAKVDKYEEALAAYNGLSEEAKRDAKPPKPPKLKETKILRERRILNDAREGWSPPAGLFNAVVYPLRKLELDGMLYYQGENNNFGLWSRYEYTFPRVITSHRQLFNDPAMPIGVIELPGWKTPAPVEVTTVADGYALIRDVHNRTVRKFDHCQMIACNDLGGQGIHPGDKRPVGERAARWALARVYGRALPHVGPVYREMKIVPAKTGGGKIMHLYFDLDPLYEKAIAAELAEDPNKKLAEWVTLPCPKGGAPYSGFAIAGEDRRWYPATVVRNGALRCLEVSSPLVDEPVAVRYGWANFPAGNAVNRGLPMLTFRTDDRPLPSSWAETPEEKQAREQAIRAQMAVARRQTLERQMAEKMSELSALDAERFLGKDERSPRKVLQSKATRIAHVIDDIRAAEQELFRKRGGNPEIDKKLEALGELLREVEAELDKLD